MSAITAADIEQPTGSTGTGTRPDDWLVEVDALTVVLLKRSRMYQIATRHALNALELHSVPRGGTNKKKHTPPPTRYIKTAVSCKQLTHF